MNFVLHAIPVGFTARCLSEVGPKLPSFEKTDPPPTTLLIGHLPFKYPHPHNVQTFRPQGCSAAWRSGTGESPLPPALLPSLLLRLPLFFFIFGRSPCRTTFPRNKTSIHYSPSHAGIHQETSMGQSDRYKWDQEINSLCSGDSRNIR